MVFYSAVKLTRIGMDGQLDLKKVGYGLIETHYRNGQKTHLLERAALDDDVWKLAGRFPYIVEDGFKQNQIDWTSLSFKAPCDLMMRDPKEKRLYQVDDFPIEKIPEFRKILLDEIDEYYDI